jgi:glycerol-3-phosphate dehydrogenase
VWYDAIALDSERLVLEYIKEAVRYGAEVANYLEVSDLKMQGARVAAVVARDLAGGRELTISCRTVINAAGPWLEHLAGASSQGGQQRWAMAMNLVVRKKLFDGVAVGLEGYTEFTDKDALIKRGKRLFFFVPWEERYTMIGTTYTPCSENPDRFSLQREMVAAMVDDINKIYPPACLSINEVTSCHAGLLPMKGESGSGDSVQLDKSSTIIDHGSVDGRQGLYSIKGVKYTTAPDIAAKVVKLLAKERWLGSPSSSRYHQQSPRYLDFGPTISRLGGDYEKVRHHLGNRYGSDWRQVFAIVVREGGGASSLWLLEDPPLLRAELLYFIEQEMAVTLADVVFRRTNIGAAECPSQEVLAILAEAMAARLDWDESEQERQKVAVQEIFAPLGR